MGDLKLIVIFLFAAVFQSAKPDLLGCCSLVDSNQHCYSVCSNIFTETSDLHLTSIQFQNLTLTCPPSYLRLWACINQTTTAPQTSTTPSMTSDLTPTTAEQNFYCCDRAEEENCTNTCRRELVKEDQVAAIQAVSAVCGDPPLGPMWECFFAPTTDPPDIEPVNIDWARIQCCNHARTSDCRDSCIKVYSGITSDRSWRTLQLDCIHRPSESSLITCLNDVSYPCKLGCSGLHFCSNFNNRPTQTFRQCSTAADHIARNEYFTWANYHRINHPLATVFLKNVQSCHPELWKALACIIHIQPCHPETHATQICREDCLRLLGDCNNSTFSPTAICDIITPAASNKNCLSLSEFTKPSPIVQEQVSLVTNPCDPNPCKSGFFCSINHLCRHGDLACSHYLCEPGCSVGEGPSLIYPSGSRIRVPVDLFSSQDYCFGFFNCTTFLPGDSQVENVPGTSPPPPAITCETQLHCSLEGQIYPHLTHFQPDDCNFCTCYYGRIVCTDLSCDITNSPYIDCECGRRYNPVCTVDGRTLPNSCIARCLGYEGSEYNLGDCNTFNPCSRHRCDRGSRCMPNRRVCLHGNGRDCTQHTCESLLMLCTEVHEPVCDASNNQHSTICNFLRTQEDFGYHGYCREECSRINGRPVCGVNGETYETFCHAESLHVAVDYNEPCKAVPGSGPDGSCAGVVCPSLSHSTCSGVKSWGSCCPKCGGHVTILMDQETLEVNSNALGKDVVSSVDIISRLRHYITSLQCDLYGYVAADSTLSVLVLPVINVSSSVVIEACNQEAVKLATLINNRAPVLVSDPYLSHLVAARSHTSDPHSTNQNHHGKLGGGASYNSAHQLVAGSWLIYTTGCIIIMFLLFSFNLF